MKIKVKDKCQLIPIVPTKYKWFKIFTKLSRIKKKREEQRRKLRVCGSVAQFKRHNFPVDDVVGRVAV